MIFALRGMEDVRVPAVMAVLAYWCLAIPMGYVLAFRFELGALGIWIGLAMGLAVLGLTLGWRFHKLTLRRLEGEGTPALPGHREASYGAGIRSRNSRATSRGDRFC